MKFCKYLLFPTLLLLSIGLQAKDYETDQNENQDVNDGMVIKNGATVTITADICVTGGTIDLQGSGKLIILNGVTLKTDQDVVNDNGTIQIDGTFNSTNGSKTFTNKAGGVIEGSGNLQISGGIVNDDGSDFFGFTGGNPAEPGGPCNAGTCSSSSMPIELASFTVSNKTSHALLEWATFSETNNDYFTIERSNDGQRFESIAKVRGAGNSVIDINYSYIDPIPLSGTSYYRLKQTDFDEQFSYSSIQVLQRAQDQVAKFVLAPNPLPKDQILSIFFDYPEVTVLRIYAENGKMLRSQVLATGRNQIDFPASTEQGIYFLSLFTQEGQLIESQKLLVH